MKTADIPFDDPATYQLLSRGETVGIFQLESPGMQSLLKQVKPTGLGDISAVLALYRPGPMGNNSHREYAHRKNAGNGRAVIHPELDDFLTEMLAETYGLIVYQEQVMEILSRMAGWGYAESENVLTAMRKKKYSLLEKAWPKFAADCGRLGCADQAVSAVWSALLPFADYSFNKAHSMGYAIVAYWTAYLKANYPQEYMTALMGSARTVEDVSLFVNEARRLNLKVLPPDVNSSGVTFTSTKEGIRYGIGHIKGIGDKAAEALLSRRPYGSIDDFFRRAPSNVLNARVLEALAQSGSLDLLWGGREALVPQAAGIAQLATQTRRAASEGHSSLFQIRYRPQYSEEGPTPKDNRLRAEWERATLGVVFTQPKIVLKLNGALTPQEWMYVKEILWAAKPSQNIMVLTGRAKAELQLLSTYSEGLREALKLVNVEVSEE